MTQRRAKSPRKTEATARRQRPTNKPVRLKMTRRARSLRYSSLTARKKSAYDRTTKLVTDLRSGEGSYTELLRKHKLGSRTARRYGGRDLLGGSRGKPVRASKADKRVRFLMFPKAVGDVPIRTRSSRAATKLSEFFHDRDLLVHDKLKAEAFEAKWLGVDIAEQEVFADAAAILRRAHAGDLNVENLYASTAGER